MCIIDKTSAFLRLFAKKIRLKYVKVDIYTHYKGATNSTAPILITRLWAGEKYSDTFTSWVVLNK